jgi:hypothetical protein
MAFARRVTTRGQHLGGVTESLEYPTISQPTWTVGPGFAINDTFVTPIREEVSAPIAVTVDAQVLPTPYDLERRQLQTRDILTPLQEWEGVVLAVGQAAFSARISDGSGDHADEEVELSREEVSEADFTLLTPGAIFYWTIGYRQRLPAGTRERVSRLRFRRLPAWSTRELAEARDRATQLARELDW